MIDPIHRGSALTAQMNIRATFGEDLVRFVERFESADVPLSARARAADAITDTLGCMVLGARQPLEPILREALFGESGGAVPLREKLSSGGLTGTATDAQGAAALYLGTLAHASDYDDISHPAYCHSTAALLPPLLVRGALIGANGQDLMTAYLIGHEVLGQLGRRLNTGHYRRGWHATSTLGTLGATAALCRLERLPAEKARMALGAAASMACGVQENFGTMAKPLHAGLPGRTAILAVRLAASGFTSSTEALDGARGFFAVFGGEADAGHPKGWAEPLEIMTENGIALKAYPSCAATHAGIDAARALRRRCDIAGPSAIKHVQVGISRFALQPLLHDWPSTPLEAKFSMRFCVAAALLDGNVDLATFTEENLARPALKMVMERITVAVDERVAEDREFATIVTIQQEGGRIEAERVKVASGKPGNWLDREQLRAKFRECVGPQARGEGEELYMVARDLDRGESSAVLLDHLLDRLAMAIDRASGSKLVNWADCRRQ